MPYAAQRLLAGVTLLLATPVLAILALAVRLTSRGPALHRARRMGPDGPFTLYKLRTMRLGNASGPAVTALGDPRITEHLDRAYRERVLPLKLEMDAAYLRDRSARGDLAILGRTIGQVLRRTEPH